MKTTAKKSRQPSLPAPADLIGLYNQMIRLRQFELAAQQSYKSGGLSRWHPASRAALRRAGAGPLHHQERVELLLGQTQPWDFFFAV